MDIVVKGRKADVSEKFRRYAAEKLGKVERLDHKIIRLEVELSEERNPRLADSKQRVEVTCVSKGPVVRAEAAAADAIAALDIALDRLQSRLRRAAGKRRVHHGTRTPESLHAAVAPPAGVATRSGDRAGAGPEAVAEPAYGGEAAEPAYGEAAEPDSGGIGGEHGVVVREKVFEARPMTLDDALFHMELVGHDFYLFADADTGLPSVVYRRKGYDYGVIRLKP